MAVALSAALIAVGVSTVRMLHRDFWLQIGYKVGAIGHERQRMIAEVRFGENPGSTVIFGQFSERA
jgi:hypothetical protein